MMTMVPVPLSSQYVYAEHVDVERHAGNEAPTELVPKPQVGERIELDEAVIQALPDPEPRVVEARKYAGSLWGLTAKVTVKSQARATKEYFLKTVSTRTTPAAHQMIRGEFESLLAIKEINPSMVPEPINYGSYPEQQSDGNGKITASVSFLLTSFRAIYQQPAPAPAPPTSPEASDFDPAQDFVSCLVSLHRSSISPTGMFGFHITTYHATLPQLTDTWDPSWSDLFTRQFSRMISHAKTKQSQSPSEIWPPRFFGLCALIVDKVIPRLLEPLQSESEGRNIKPCLVHGDLWDENTAQDATTGQPFIFDACSFYAHNEYEIGNWRAKRHRLSRKEYVEAYKKLYPPSEPAHEWDDRNLLYSLRFDLGAAVLIPGSNDLKQTVRQNMEILCEKFFPEELRLLLA